MRIESVLQARLHQLKAMGTKNATRRAAALLVLREMDRGERCTCRLCIGRLAGITEQNVSVLLHRYPDVFAYTSLPVRWGRGHVHDSRKRVTRGRQWYLTLVGMGEAEKFTRRLNTSIGALGWYTDGIVTRVPKPEAPSIPLLRLPRSPRSHAQRGP